MDDFPCRVSADLRRYEAEQDAGQAEADRYAALVDRRYEELTCNAQGITEIVESLLATDDNFTAEIFELYREWRRLQLKANALDIPRADALCQRLETEAQRLAEQHADLKIEQEGKS